MQLKKYIGIFIVAVLYLGCTQTDRNGLLRAKPPEDSPPPTKVAAPPIRYDGGDRPDAPGKEIGRKTRRRPYPRRIGGDLKPESSSTPHSFYAVNKLVSQGGLPPAEMIRVTDFVNRFDYDYLRPEGGPIGVDLVGGPSLLGGDGVLLLVVGVNGRDVIPDQSRASALTFVIDVSPSMGRNDRLELIKRGLTQLVDNLGEMDRIAIVTFGSKPKVILYHTEKKEREKLLGAINGLGLGDAGIIESGLDLGYQVASEGYMYGGQNRVVLCSAGLLVPGKRGIDSLTGKVKRFSKEGMTLTALGFDPRRIGAAVMKELANNGAGRFTIIASPNETRRAFIEALTGRDQIIAKDIDVKVNFNPEVVSRFRRLGSARKVEDEPRLDVVVVHRKDLGIGYQRTVVYELRVKPGLTEGEVATVRAQFKGADQSVDVNESEWKIALADFSDSYGGTSPDFVLAAMAAGYCDVMVNKGPASSLETLLRNIPAKLRSRNDAAEFIKLIQGTVSAFAKTK